MKRIKANLIHWLGGRTAEESADMTLHARNIGIYAGKCLARRAMRIYADRLYGRPAEEWCEKMYEYITKEDSF